MKRRKYPLSLFIIGFITNVLFHFFWLFIPAIILLIVGIFIKECLYGGIALLILDLILSLVEQLRIRNAVLQDSDSPDFKRFQGALSEEGSWMENIQNFVEESMDNTNE